MKCILHLTTSIPRKADICFIGDRLIGLIGRCEAPARNEREKVSTLEWDAKSDSSNKNKKKKKNGNISKRNTTIFLRYIYIYTYICTSARNIPGAGLLSFTRNATPRSEKNLKAQFKIRPL